MKRRQFTTAGGSLLVWGWAHSPAAHAALGGLLSEGDASLGVKTALERGAVAAVACWGRPMGS